MTIAKTWYHGTNRKLPHNLDDLVFDRNRTEDLNQEGPGLYLTSSLEEAMGYGRNIYEATIPSKTRILVSGASKPKASALLKLYKVAHTDHKLLFLSNWGYETLAPEPVVLDILRKHYCDQDMHTGMILLYHDLFNYNSGAYVKAARVLTDAILVQREKSRHLVVLNTRKINMAR